MKFPKLTILALATSVALTSAPSLAGTLTDEPGICGSTVCTPAVNTPEPSALTLLIGAVAAAGAVRAIRRRK